MFVAGALTVPALLSPRPLDRPGLGRRPRDRGRRLLGGYLGASLQSRLPEALLRRGLGVLALTLGVHYALLGFT